MKYLNIIPWKCGPDQIIIKKLEKTQQNNTVQTY